MKCDICHGGGISMCETTAEEITSGGGRLTQACGLPGISIPVTPFFFFFRKGRLLITEWSRIVTESTLYPLLGNIGNEFRINYGRGVILSIRLFP